MEANSKITQWVIDHSGGTIRDESQATLVLLVAVVVGIMFSLYTFGTVKNREPQAGPVPPGQVVPQ